MHIVKMPYRVDKMAESKKIPVKLLLGLAIVVIIAILVFGMVKTTNATIEDNRLKINGFYGLTIPITDIKDAVILENISNIGARRTNGIGIGPIKIGYFDYTGLGKARLFVLNFEKSYLNDYHQ